MPRYGGGHEDFREQEAMLRAMEERLASIEAKEAIATGALEDLGAAEDTATTKRRTLNKAKREGAEITERERAVAGQEAAAVDVDTAAIERNRVARERRADAARREAINVNRAFRGAGDPLFAQATASGISSQYGLRREFGIGGGRADKLREAINAPFLRPAQHPSEWPRPGDQGAQTRVQAAESALVQADIELAEAKRLYAANVRRGDQAAAEAARGQRELAANARRAANVELESAHSAAASAAELAAARKQAAIAATREAEASVVAGGGPGSALIPHPTQFQGGKYVQTTQAVERGIQPGLEATRTAAAAAAGSAHAKVLQEQAAAEALAAQGAAAHTAALAAEEAALLASSQAAATTARTQIAERAVANAGALRNEGIALNSVSQAMHKHGALTQEFILAAARGETTLKELGNQALVTAGKFGGWTAAATGLFAVAGAIGQVGHGAITASSGVHTLDRVLDRSTYNSDAAQQAFADLSREFNVPMETAVDAVYRMGQRFHSFPAAVEAARASLYSFKTGEVDVATSTENLLAIVNGFGLSSKDLSAVYDQINQAQNTFGIRIRDTEAGLAKAAGTYRNAGGDLNYLLALTTAIGRATNRSGQEIGTGIARGVNEIRKSVNQAKLEAQGVNVIPDNFQKTLQSALKVARTDPKADLQQLASGLFGNQYARLIAPVLRDQRTLNQALKDTSPEASKASAQKELAKVLEQADERIKSVGIELQNLGAALNRAGAFNLAGLLLDGLTDVLSLAVRIVEVFDKLPEPIRDAATMAAELAVTIKLLQRFGGTERLAGGPLGFLSAPDTQFAARAKSGLRGARDAARDESERAGQRAYRVRNAAERAQILASEAAETATLVERTGTAQQQIAANQELARANALAEKFAVDAAAASQEAAAARLLAAAGDEEYAAAAKLSSKALAAKVRSELIPVQAEFPPSSAGLENSPEHLAQQRSAAALASGSRNTLSSSGMAVRNNLLRYYENGVANIQTLTREQVRLGTVGRGLDAAAHKGIQGAARATTMVENAARRIGGLGGGLKNFMSALGPLDIAIGAYFVLDALGSDMEESQKKLQEQVKSVNKTPQTAAGMAKYRSQLKEQAKQHVITNADAWEDFRALANPLNLFGDITGIGGYQSPTQQRETQVADPARAALAEQNRIKAEQRERGKLGLTRANLTYDQLSKDIDRDQQDVRAGLISQREFRTRMVRHAKEATQLYFPTADSIQKAMAAVADAQRESGSGADYATSLKGLNANSLQAQATMLASNIKDFGSGGGQLRRLAQVYDAQVNVLAGSDSAEDIKALSDARNTYFSTIQDAAQYDLQAALTADAGEGSRRAAYARAARAEQTGLVGRARDQLAGARDRLASARRRAAAARQAVHEGPDRVNLGQLPGQDTGVDPFGLTFTAEGAVEDLHAEAIKTAKRVRDLMRKRGKFNKELRAAIKANNDAQRILAEANFQDREEGRQIDLALLQSQTTDPVVAANEAVRFAQEALGRAQASGKVRKIKVAMTNVNNARKEQSDVVKQQAEQVAQDARALTDARFDYLESQTTDPLRVAHLETQKARADIKGTTGAERLTAKATYNRAIQSERDTKLQSREEDIEFERTMGRLTVDEAITRYRQLLQVRNLTKQQKRDIQQKIRALKQEGESEASGFDLDVGSIRMPTLYDVRRAWDPIREHGRENAHAMKAADIRSNVSHMYHARSQVQAHIQVYVNDKNAAGEVFTAIDRALGTSVRAHMRSRGMRG